MVKGEVERVHLRAAVGILVGVRVVAALVVGLAVPCVAVARVHRHREVRGVVDDKLECHDAVAASRVGEIGLIGPGGRISTVMPCEAATGNGASVAGGEYWYGLGADHKIF